MLIHTNIEITLLENDVKGIISSRIKHGKSRLLIIPRAKVSNLEKISEIQDEMNHAHVLYLLIGRNEFSTQFQVYVGKTMKCSSRLKHHLSVKEFWDTAVIFSNINMVYPSDCFSEDDVTFLEWFSYNKVKESSKYYCLNEKPPTKPHKDKSNIEKLYFSELEKMLSILGYNMFEADLREDKDTYYIKSGILYAMAELVLNDNNEQIFVVKRGSEANISTADSIHAGYKKLKMSLIENKTLKQIEDRLVFQKDFVFSSPSAAASIILGYRVSGPDYWKNDSGHTLKEILNS